MLESKEIVHAIHKRMIDLQMVMSDACEYLSDLDESDDMVKVYSTRYNESYERYRELRSLLYEIMMWPPELAMDEADMVE